MNVLLLTSESSDSNDPSDSTEDEVDYISTCYYIVIQRIRNSRNSVPNFVENVVPKYSEKEFVTQFRIGSNIFEYLVEQFSATDGYRNLFSKPGARQSISAEKQILTFLYFVGHEAEGYRAINNLFDMSLSTLHQVINRVADFICSLGSQIIKWPNKGHIQEIKAYFNFHKKMPDVVGLIDGTSIVIDKPSVDPDAYINRKGSYSIHMQGIVDHRKKFIDVFIGYPGSVHDARVFQNSSIFNNLSQLCDGGYILGDSAYPLMGHLLTPYKDNGQLNQQQQFYNNQHSSTRIYVEHAFGILKQRFRQLYHLKLRKPRLIVKVIKACCILHNIANLEQLEILEGPVQETDMQNVVDLIDNNEDEVDDSDDGKKIRNDLTSRLWNYHQE